MFVIILLATVSALLILWDRFSHANALFSKIPGPKSWPIIGNAFSNILPRDKLFYYQLELFKKYGPIFHIRGLNFRMVSINDPEEIEKVLSTTLYEKTDIYKFLIPWFGEGLLISRGKKWHHRRKLLTKAFHFNILKKYCMTFFDAAEEFLKTVQKEANSDKNTDLYSLMSITTLRIMCETTMGFIMNDENSEMFTKYLNSTQILSECFSERIFNGLLHVESIYNLTKLARDQNIGLIELHKFTNRVIKERKMHLQNENKLNSFDDCNEIDEDKNKLAMLDLLFKSETSSLIDDVGIKEEVDTFMFEGHDTTATALTFIIMAIANEPEIQNKIYEEITNILRDSQTMPTIQDLKDMKYLDCCVKEALRLYPSVPIISRQLHHERQLGGYTIPANTYCFIHIFNLHRRADIFHDPERFIPERFLTENCTDRHQFAFIPFSAGPRNCIGQKFAVMKIKILIISLIRKFRILPVTRVSDLHFKTDITLRTRDPIYVRFRARV